MNAIKRYRNRLERFLQTERGKRFINFAYSIGAAIVILGAMFKLLHFPFGNQMLFIGMMTEVVVFILSAFDRPVQDYAWEEVFPALSSRSPDDRSGTGTTYPPTTHMSKQHSTHETLPHGISSEIFGSKVNPDSKQETVHHGISSRTEEYERQLENLNQTLSGLNSIYEVQLKGISSQIATIEQINQGLNRLHTAYSDALPPGVSIKEETQRMADQLKELNDVYARMLNAMTYGGGNNPENKRS